MPLLITHSPIKMTLIHQQRHIATVFAILLKCVNINIKAITVRNFNFKIKP